MFRKHKLFPLSYLLMIEKNKIRRYPISGARSLGNFFWTIIIFSGSIGFLFIGFCSYLNYINNKGVLPIAENIQFFPQGLVMIFYGLLGFFLSFYLSLTLFWSLGSGFNEFNKCEGYVRIFRWGFPGEDRRVNFYYSWDDILGIRVQFQQANAFGNQSRIFLQVKGQKEIPLTNIGEP
uniref:Photosystem I assembly protein Ycf4 n=1 Tax=Caulerpa lentillifera TaxID=148947 RepID=A0A345HGV9_9CHLO|nr:photosystem I assembly protein Ycf4 [Caulerpa lentillifera]AXG75849.1 photosystem I assembly protein Ycf4 [Caulerpa lentillifera]QKS32293.1 photosystem I assembly protein Ycf4 [Caulerpa lentillifera]QUV75653.1 photosystem I assembly protein Ycf4 [Caulerpa lentillifera]